MTLAIGDHVRVTERFGIAKPGDTGRVHGFTTPDAKGTSNPLIDLQQGRALVPARLLTVEPRPDAKIAAPAPAWEPKEDEAEMRGAWTDERRAKFRATMAARREARMQGQGEAMRAENGTDPISSPSAPPRPQNDAVAVISEGTHAVARLSAPSPSGMRDELAASVAALRRAVASAAVEGEGVGQIQRLVLALGSLEQTAGEVNG